MSSLRLQAQRYELRLGQQAERLKKERDEKLMEVTASHEAAIDARLAERSRQLLSVNKQLEASLRLYCEVSRR